MLTTLLLSLNFWILCKPGPHACQCDRDNREFDRAFRKQHNFRIIIENLSYQVYTYVINCYLEVCGTSLSLICSSFPDLKATPLSYRS